MANMMGWMVQNTHAGQVVETERDSEERGTWLGGGAGVELEITKW